MLYIYFNVKLNSGFVFRVINAKYLLLGPLWNYSTFMAFIRALDITV